MIRNAVKEDAEKILAIYSYYVKNTAISFEHDVPSLDEFQGRIVRTLERYPYLVLEEKGVILGYAYAGVLKNRDCVKKGGHSELVRLYSGSCHRG